MILIAEQSAAQWTFFRNERLTDPPPEGEANQYVKNQYSWQLFYHRLS